MKLGSIIYSILYKGKSLSCVRLFAIPWTVAHQAPPSMGFSRQEYWSGLPFLSPGDFSDLGIKPRSPALEADALTSEPPGRHIILLLISQQKLYKSEGNGNPLQHSCLENPMDGGAWWATLHGVTKSWTRCLFFHLFVKYTHTYKCMMYILVLDAFLWFLVCMTNVAVALKCTI